VIDRGLLLTMALMAVVVAAADRGIRRRGSPAEPVLSLASTPLVVGLAAARLAAVALDDPATMLRPFDLLLIRGGMELWPGVAAAAAAVWLATARTRSGTLERVAELVPFALLAYAVYEATCLLRDGCFGPSSPVGLRPGGLGPRQVPVGVFVGLTSAALAVSAWRASRFVRPSVVSAFSVLGLAASRSAAGFYLPKVSAGLTRSHRESLLVLTLALLWAAVAFSVRGRAGLGSAPVDRSAPAPSDDGA